MYASFLTAHMLSKQLNRWTANNIQETKEKEDNSREVGFSLNPKAGRNTWLLMERETFTAAQINHSQSLKQEGTCEVV